MAGKEGQAIVGTCKYMCPEAEFELRRREELLHPLELTKRNGRRVADISIAVKEFSRSAAGRKEAQSCDLRPQTVLTTTMQYLLGSISNVENGPWSNIYDFVFDRLRAVRQDMVLQELGGLGAIAILESIIRFHIYASYRLCDQPIEKFDPKINDQHTQECLKRLIYLYKCVDGNHSNREEFESIYIIFNLGHTDALMHYYDLPLEVRHLPLVKRSYLVSVAMFLGNYIRTLRMLASSIFELYPLCLLAAHRHLGWIQRRALQVMSSGFNSKSLIYPSYKLAELLWFESMESCVTECRNCGLTIKDDHNIVFQKSTFKDPGKLVPTPTSGIGSVLCKWTIPNLLLGTKVAQNKTNINQVTVSMENMRLCSTNTGSVT